MKSKICILFTSALILAACSSSEDEVSDTPKVRPAKLVTVSDASTSRSISFPAIIEAENSSELTFQVNGQIIELSVLEGDPVEEGQVIARVEERDYQNSLVQAQAQYDNAETEYQRAKRLVEQDAISRSVLETRKTNRDVAQAVLDTARKAATDTVLRAPFSGFISKIFVERFQNIQAKEVIANLQSNEVVALVNAPADIVARSPQFEPENTAVMLDAAPNVSISAVFKEASGQADPATQTYQISFKFSAPDNIIVLPGMTATVSTDFQFNGSSDIVPSGIAVPVAAVVAEGDTLFVWRVDKATMEISKALIVTGTGMSEKEVIVTSGLNKDDLIVAAGGSFLHSGMKVRAWQAN
ncbi:efflux RND transporter periplasmic adaptor subunit [Kordiimonas aquimaris]|uniref:efflux RND transporter periplasmic adaptor subunit n=1 Tax=Kordiimonas aquimaris TaxID=707591 RepID=UPI0021D10BA7|nr:efflux RND transporter periplasmic adaptor subunit [Kordiimonas aquimaris]